MASHALPLNSLLPNPHHAHPSHCLPGRRAHHPQPLHPALSRSGQAHSDAPDCSDFDSKALNDWPWMPGAASPTFKLMT